MTVSVVVSGNDVTFNMSEGSQYIYARASDLTLPSPSFSGGSADDLLDLSQYTMTQEALDVYLNRSPGLLYVWDPSLANRGLLKVTLKSIEHLRGTDYNDHLHGNSVRNILIGDTSESVANAARASDQLYGYGGNDELYGFAGDDLLNGGAGADKLAGGSGSDTADYYGSWVTQGVVVDLLNNALNTNDAKGDKLTSIESLNGTKFGDSLYGSNVVNSLSGSDGNDTLVGRGGNDRLFGESGKDVLYGDDGNDILNGGLGTDQLFGGNGVDTVTYGSMGSAAIINLVDHALNGGSAKGERLSSIENIIATAYHDVITGNTVSNSIDGSRGNDIIKAGSGNDRIIGGMGADDLYGGSGNDVFVFEAASESTAASNGRDSIFDFAPGDKIDLSKIDPIPENIWRDHVVFIGTAAFSGRKGEIRLVEKVSDTYIYGDINGDKLTDFMIHLDDAVKLVGSDFFL